MLNRRIFTYANVMATIAVFVAIGGTTYAAAKLNGSSIARRSIPANRVKVNSLTGAEVKESRLGIVPRAAKANRATTATTATAATTATRATSADGADRLGGMTQAELLAAAKRAATPTCASDTELVVGLCYETTLRPAAAYSAAVRACATAGRRLPGVGEVLAYTAIKHLNGAERTDQYYYDDATTAVFRASSVYDNGTDGSGSGHPDSGTPSPYRCVAPPTIA